MVRSQFNGALTHVPIDWPPPGCSETRSLDDEAMLKDQACEGYYFDVLSTIAEWEDVTAKAEDSESRKDIIDGKKRWAKDPAAPLPNYKPKTATANRTDSSTAIETYTIMNDAEFKVSVF